MWHLFFAFCHLMLHTASGVLIPSGCLTNVNWVASVSSPSPPLLLLCCPLLLMRQQNGLSLFHERSCWPQWLLHWRQWAVNGHQRFCASAKCRYSTVDGCIIPWSWSQPRSKYRFESSALSLWSSSSLLRSMWSVSVSASESVSDGHWNAAGSLISWLGSSPSCVNTDDSRSVIWPLTLTLKTSSSIRASGVTAIAKTWDVPHDFTDLLKSILAVATILFDLIYCTVHNVVHFDLQRFTNPTMRHYAIQRTFSIQRESSIRYHSDSRDALLASSPSSSPAWLTFSSCTLSMMPRVHSISCHSASKASVALQFS